MVRAAKPSREVRTPLWKLPRRSAHQRSRTSLAHGKHGRSAARVGRLITAVIFLKFTGCDYGVELEGTVVTESNQPIDSAEVLVTCPALCVYGKSDPVGRISGSQLGGCPLDCTITIRRVGRDAFSSAVRPHCRKESRPGVCSLIHVDARLKLGTKVQNGTTQ
jgi:hypothetical protein